MAATTDKIHSFFTFDRPSNQSYKPMNATLVDLPQITGLA